MAARSSRRASTKAARFTTAAVAAAAGAYAFHAERRALGAAGAMRGPGGGEEGDFADDTMLLVCV